MNEFTKEELEIINGCIWMITNSLTSSGSIDVGKQQDLVVLNAKIQSMIDNYCPHTDTYDCDYCGIVSCEDCKKACGGELNDY